MISDQQERHVDKKSAIQRYESHFSSIQRTSTDAFILQLGNSSGVQCPS